ncbi:MAG: nucleotidyltransferase domain-containing protein [Sedimentisphaerales bacterium]|nr:nucleotidyltransferase domain-containing protein [Sedimentisphaerales bacterium]
MAISESILTTIKSLKDHVRQDYKAEIKGIFGSHVRNEQTSQSDIDILAQFQQDADIFDFVGLSQFLEDRLNCKVDVVPNLNFCISHWISHPNLDF